MKLFLCLFHFSFTKAGIKPWRWSTVRVIGLFFVMKTIIWWEIIVHFNIFLDIKL